MVEFVLGRLRAALPPDTRIGFLEPDFRTPLARLAYLEVTGRRELSPLRIWAVAINQLYQANKLSPDIGSILAKTLEYAGFHLLGESWSECLSDTLTIENMVMFYDEVRDQLNSLGILTANEVEEQQRLLRVLPTKSLPAVWGIHGVTCRS